jgi:hypothetical protein
LLTLYTTPVIYLFLERLKRRVGRAPTALAPAAPAVREPPRAPAE